MAQSHARIVNPALPGFNPDPSLLRVGDDFYIATSTFEWFPGVAIHHSRDLVHWELLTFPLSRISQLDMRGVPDSSGIWAPCLTHDGELFHLVYTNVKSRGWPFMDMPNFVVTAREITGPWSEPVYLNSSGFDPSLFHDDDGRKWLVNTVLDDRDACKGLCGIQLQEYDPRARRLVGPIHELFAGTALGCTEGPHLYKRQGTYYLMVAEGGTGYEHAVTVARSSRITGPYEVDPQNPMLTSVTDPSLLLQKSGHASLVETQTGQWYIAHLCGRPIDGPNRGGCLLGRETALQQVEWTGDGWLRLVGGGNVPAPEVAAPDLPPAPSAGPRPERIDFDDGTLPLDFQTLRVPREESWLSLRRRPGHLSLRGRESFTSQFDQSLVARRLQSFHVTAETSVESDPKTFQQMAGLVCYSDTKSLLYLKVTADAQGRKILTISQVESGDHKRPVAPVDVDGLRVCHLGVDVDHDRLQFRYSRDGRAWTPIGPAFDTRPLSDSYQGKYTFTGAFVGVCAQDLYRQEAWADFDYFVYRER